jgi:hypothetical protein
MRKIGYGLAAGALAVAATIAAVPGASAAGPTNHFILLANKSVVLKVCATAHDVNGVQVGHKCQSTPAGQKFLYWVPNNTKSTRFTASDRGQQMIGEDLANTQDWCYRAPFNKNGKVTGPHTPCTSD